MEAIFGVKLAYQDPHVRQYGLENALFPFGLAFVEVVSPVEAGRPLPRALERRWRLYGDLQLQRSGTARPPCQRARSADGAHDRASKFSRRAAPPARLPGGDDRVRS